MLFCSSVATEGSVIPAGAAVDNAAWDDWSRFDMRSKMATEPAAHRPEMIAINKIWRADSLYIKRLPSLTNDLAKEPNVRCFRNNRSLCLKTDWAELRNSNKFRTEYLTPAREKDTIQQSLCSY